MTQNKLRNLTQTEIECLERYAQFDISLEQLRRCLRGVVKFDFSGGEGKRWMENRFAVPEPGILITKQHLENALTRRRDGIISEGQLVEWATMILHNLAYELDPKDEDLLAEWLNDISFDLRPEC